MPPSPNSRARLLWQVAPADRMPSNPLRLPRFRSDVLVVGGGMAGLTAALVAADRGVQVSLLAKGRVGETNTRFAQGGMAAAMGPNDHPELHSRDTRQVGCGLAEPGVVDALCEQGPEAFRWLEAQGAEFDRNDRGELVFGREGGHSLPRVLHANGAATGKEIQRALQAAAIAHPRIHLYEQAFAVDLLRNEEGRNCGVVALGPGAQGGAAIFEACSVLLATGGGGQLYRETTNPDLATADGLAMALRAGAVLRDLEFVQFHPTILYLAGAARFLISEVVRGAGGVLRDRHGRAFMADAHPDAELAPRDVVSRAIYHRMIETQDTHVYLDLSGVAQPEEQFPEITRIAGLFGLDLTRDALPVRPAVHYFVGGIRVDLNGRSSEEGLWACGECSSTGLHGANRMGSNSLLEGLVHGRMVGDDLVNHLPERSAPPVFRPHSPFTVPDFVALNLTDMTYSLKSLMWRNVGVEREEDGLSDALERMTAWSDYLARLGPTNRDGFQVMNMVLVGQAITLCALERRETLGTHFRADCPDEGYEDLRHSLLTAVDGLANIDSEPVSSSCISK